MKMAIKCVAYPVAGAAFLIIWGGHLLIYLSAIIAVVGAFIDGGVLVGLISIPLVGLGVFIARLIWGLVTLPLFALAAGALTLTEERPS